MGRCSEGYLDELDKRRSEEGGGRGRIKKDQSETSGGHSITHGSCAHDLIGQSLSWQPRPGSIGSIWAYEVY